MTANVFYARLLQHVDRQSIIVDEIQATNIKKINYTFLLAQLCKLLVMFSPCYTSDLSISNFRNTGVLYHG